MYPYFSRDIGGDILYMIQDSKDDVITLQDSTDFASDGLFCEWAYVIDLDNMKLEVYNGFHKKVIKDVRQRFESNINNDNEYKSVQLLHTFDINNLPKKRDFIKLLIELDKKYQDN